MVYEITAQTAFCDHVQAEALEKGYFRSEVVASAQTTWGWARANSETLFVLREKEKPLGLIGHLSAFPVRQEIASLLVSGEMKDTEIPSCAVLPYGSGEPASLYIAAICVDRAHRPRGALLLLSFFAQFLEKKREQGEIVDSLLAEAGTKDGQRLLERRGFQKCHEGQPIPCYYRSSVLDFCQRLLPFKSATHAEKEGRG